MKVKVKRPKEEYAEESEEATPPSRADRFTWYADDVVIEEE